MHESDRPRVAPVCGVARHELSDRKYRDRMAEEARLQRRFERICARELLGEID
ncbi:hypothetical protein [Sphingomonas suaedae]|uniref:hypothetical protein n=1 Tax=Sphingomonas suaedae TaxID=2599297 RepID=UPI0016450FB2|nr:hypothetical protein [Sphingomonas suaedae]